MKKLIALSLLLVVFACKAEKQSFSRPAAELTATDSAAVQRLGGAEPPYASGAQPPDASGAQSPTAPAAPAMPRMIVRTANVSIVVDDTSRAVKAITERSEAAGGYVADSRIWRDGELLRATLTIRVPAEKLTATLASIRTVARRVENETIASEDVSREYVDLESQLRNLEATEVELRQLLTTVREKAKRAADILEVHQQLTVIRSQIEQLRGRMRYLSQVSAMSSVTLNVIPDAIAQPVVQPGWQPLVTVKDAGRALVTALQGMANVAIWLIILGGPLALLAWLAGRGIARVWKVRKSLPS